MRTKFYHTFCPGCCSSLHSLFIYPKQMNLFRKSSLEADDCNHIHVLSPQLFPFILRCFLVRGALAMPKWVFVCLFSSTLSSTWGLFGGTPDVCTVALLQQRDGRVIWSLILVLALHPELPLLSLSEYGGKLCYSLCHNPGYLGLTFISPVQKNK